MRALTIALTVLVTRALADVAGVAKVIDGPRRLVTLPSRPAHSCCVA